MSHAAHADTHAHDASHGHDDHDHKGHVIVSPFMLRTVLAILLFFTALTVGVSVGEQWIMGYFNIELPWWVNVAGAMSIAVVKAVLVMAIFMQLRWDNPMNTVVMLFTFAALAIFLFFTGLDLFSRGNIYSYKAGPILAGGGAMDRVADAKTKFKQKIRDKNPSWTADQVEAEFARLEAEEHAKHGGHASHADHGPANTANRSRPMTGLTGALTGSSHGHSHGDASHESAKPAEHAPSGH